MGWIAFVREYEQKQSQQEMNKYGWHHAFICKYERKQNQQEIINNQSRLLLFALTNEKQSQSK